MFLRHTAQVFAGHSPHLVAKRLPEVCRPLRPLIVDKHPQHRRLALKLPWKGFDGALLGRFQLLLGDQFLTHTPDLIEYDLRGQGHGGVFALKSSPKIARIPHPRLQ